MDQTNQFLEDLNLHYNDAVKYCRSLCAKWSPQEAEDVLQQSLLKAMENYSQLREREKFRAWLFQIITNTFYSFTRRNFWKRFLPLSSATRHPEIPPIYKRQDCNEIKLLVRKALSQLSAKERTAILLFEIGGFSIDEIVSIQNDNTASAVKSRLSRARKKMREFIQKGEKSHAKPQENPLKLVGDIDQETLNLLAKLDVKGSVD